MPSESLRILCFGDSLTSGYHNWGLDSQPYSIVLKSRLRAAYPDGLFEVYTSGVPGDVAAFPQFTQRLHNLLAPPRTFDWVIILGGTNDIAMGVPVKKIFDVLEALWNFARLRGSKVLALTVPEAKGARAGGAAARARTDLNNRILEHKADKFYAFDLNAMIPYHSLTELQLNRYWDDGLHLTKDGYDWMGGHIADALMQILTHGNTEPAPQWSAKRDDTVVLDEEEGSPDILSQGYIVVRKRDLH